MQEFGDHLDTITLIRSEKGRFEVTIDGREIYSKSRTKRHPNPDEVVDLIRQLQSPTTLNLHSNAHHTTL